MSTPEDSLLGREVAYPRRYDPALLFPIARAPARTARPRRRAVRRPRPLACLRAVVAGRAARRSPPPPCASRLYPHLVGRESLKLYLNSLNAERFEAPGRAPAHRRRLSRATGGPVAVDGPAADGRTTARPARRWVDIDRYGPPDLACSRRSRRPGTRCTPAQVQLPGHRSPMGHDRHRLPRPARPRRCCATGPPDHAGPRAVWNRFVDVSAAPRRLSVEAYTRRGGLDINPWRATPGTAPPPPRREDRQ